MTGPLLLMLSNIASKLPHQGAVVLFHLPIGLGVVGRGIVRGYTQKTENALVIYRGKLRSVVRKDRVGDAMGSHPSVNERLRYRQRRRIPKRDGPRQLGKPVTYDQYMLVTTPSVYSTGRLI